MQMIVSVHAEAIKSGAPGAAAARRTHPPRRPGGRLGGPGLLFVCFVDSNLLFEVDLLFFVLVVNSY